LDWVGETLPALGHDEIEIEMSGLGLNYLDFAAAMDVIDTSHSPSKGHNTLGSEGAGIVTKNGANVTDFKIGDQVVAISFDTDIFAARTQRLAKLCVRLPLGLSTEDAVGLLITYATVLWVFVEKARVQKGQSVLIHSAANG
jgi:NADPH:quinone reductase-like Zn-dependent oxidoreductase